MAFWTGMIVSAFFFFMYLYSIGDFGFGFIPLSFEFMLVEGWPEKVFKMRAPFLWEAIGIFYIYGGVAISLSIPNIMLALLLSSLVFLNIAIVVYTYKLPKICRLEGSSKPLLGIIPSFLTGFACCVPTFIIAAAPILGSLTVFFVKLRPYLIPISILIMAWGAVSSIKRIPENI